MPFHYILIYVVSIKKLPVNSIEDPLYIKNNFSLLLSRINLCCWLLTVWLCVWVWKSLGLFYLECIKLLEYTGVSEDLATFISSSIIFVFLYISIPAGTSIMNMLVCSVVSHKSLRLCLFFFTHFFLIFRLNNFTWPNFKFTDFYFC